MTADRDGHEYPPWHVRDHQSGGPGPRSCISIDHGTGPARAAARLPWTHAGPEVAAWLLGTGEIGTVSADTPRRAAALAQFIELAADAPKEKLRALAAHVRQAAAEIWPGQEPEAGL